MAHREVFLTNFMCLEMRLKHHRSSQMNFFFIKEETWGKLYRACAYLDQILKRRHGCGFLF